MIQTIYHWKLGLKKKIHQQKGMDGWKVGRKLGRPISNDKLTPRGGYILKKCPRHDKGEIKCSPHKKITTSSRAPSFRECKHDILYIKYNF